MYKNVYWYKWAKQLTSLTLNKFKLGGDWYDDIFSEIAVIILKLHTRKNFPDSDSYCYLKGVIFSEVLEKVSIPTIKAMNGFSNSVKYALDIKEETPTSVTSTISSRGKDGYVGSMKFSTNEALYGYTDGQEIQDFNDTMLIVNEELKKLPNTHQKVLKMLWEGYNMEEIEKTLNINRVTAWRINERFQEVMNQKRQKGEM